MLIIVTKLYETVNTIILGTLLFKRGQCLQNPQVKLSSGTVEGFHQKSFNGKDFISFEGIPYAQPPVGNNRFKVSYLNCKNSCKKVM